MTALTATLCGKKKVGRSVFTNFREGGSIVKKNCDEWMKVSKIASILVTVSVRYKQKIWKKKRWIERE